MERQGTDSPSKKISRRTALVAAGGTAGALLVANRAQAAEESKPLKGRIKQSVSRWCYEKIKLNDLCREANAMGIVGIDLVGEREWRIIQGHGLVPTMAWGPGQIPKGWNDPANHEQLIARSEEMLPKIGEAGLPNMIVFSGNRNGMKDDVGLANCVEGLKKIMPLAEKLDVNVVIELLNSKRNHKDYMADHTAWAVELAQEIGSKKFKVLYDIYHMQIMEGDVIATIQENIEYIGHIHTGGVPGRNEIDDTQELNYRRICEAIVETGFDGYVAHEFVPKRDPLTSLRQAVEICDV